MNRKKNPLVWFNSTLLFLGLVLFYSCGSTTQPNVSTTPLSANGILEKARQASLADATFTLIYKQNTVISGLNQSISATGKGNLTANPRRSYIYHSLSSQGTTTSVETISDTTHIYQRVVSSTRWDQESLPDESDPNKYLSSLTGFLDYMSFQHSTVDIQSLNDRITYHVKSVQPILSPSLHNDNGTNIFELWLDQNSYFPLQFKMQQDGTGNSEFGKFTTSITTTIIFTQWNSSVTILIPQV